MMPFGPMAKGSTNIHWNSFEYTQIVIGLVFFFSHNYLVMNHLHVATLHNLKLLHVDKKIYTKPLKNPLTCPSRRTFKWRGSLPKSRSLWCGPYSGLDYEFKCWVWFDSLFDIAQNPHRCE
jgi:hypothetical protein